LITLTILCALVPVRPVSGKATPQVNVPVHLWIAYGPQTRTPDGAVTQRFYIRSGGRPSEAVRPQDGDFSDVQAFYRFGNHRGLQPTFYRALILDQDGELYLDVATPVMARVEVMVTARLSGSQGATRLAAQTTIFLFGKKVGNPNPTASEPLTLPLPWLHLLPDHGHYWMQTGATYAFTFNGPNPAGTTVRVLENRRQIDSLVPAANGDFVYTPPHDPRLDRTGPDAGKSTVLLVHAEEGGRELRSAYTLRLHRTRHGHQRLWPGLVLFGFTAAATGIVVGHQRRRRPY
jgi:hypothetical protein